MLPYRLTPLQIPMQANFAAVSLSLMYPSSPNNYCRTVQIITAHTVLTSQLGCWSTCAKRVLHSASYLFRRIIRFGHASNCMAPFQQKISFLIIALVQPSLLGLLRRSLQPSLHYIGCIESLLSPPYSVRFDNYTATNQNCAFSVMNPSLWNGLHWCCACSQGPPQQCLCSLRNYFFQTCWSRDRS